MDVYENIIVGNFLFGLGVKIGLQHRSSPIEPISVNLLQQTPLDQPLGDVVVANAHVFRLVEFKRASSSSRKEASKWKLMMDALESKVGADIDLARISRKIH